MSLHITEIYVRSHSLIMRNITHFPLFYEDRNLYTQFLTTWTRENCLIGKYESLLTFHEEGYLRFHMILEQEKSPLRTGSGCVWSGSEKIADFFAATSHTSWSCPFKILLANPIVMLIFRRKMSITIGFANNILKGKKSQIFFSSTSHTSCQKRTTHIHPPMQAPYAPGNLSNETIVVCPSF